MTTKKQEIVNEERLKKSLGFVPFDKQQEILDSAAREVVIAAGGRFWKTATRAYLFL